MSFFKKHSSRSAEIISFLPGALKDVSDEQTPTQETARPEPRGRFSLHWICKVDLIIGIVAIIMMVFLIFKTHIL